MWPISSKSGIKNSDLEPNIFMGQFLISNCIISFHSWTVLITLKHYRSYLTRRIDWKRTFCVKFEKILVILFWKKISGDIFRAAPYRLMLVLKRDALFHWPMSSISGIKNSDLEPNIFMSQFLISNCIISFHSRTVLITLKHYCSYLTRRIDWKRTFCVKFEKKF